MKAYTIEQIRAYKRAVLSKTEKTYIKRLSAMREKYDLDNEDFYMLHQIYATANKI